MAASENQHQQIIPKFYYPFKAFTILNFTITECFLSLKHDIFVIKKLFYSIYQGSCYHFFIFKIIVENVNLIQMLK